MPGKVVGTEDTIIIYISFFSASLKGSGTKRKNKQDLAQYVHNKYHVEDAMKDQKREKPPLPVVRKDPQRSYL